MPACVWYCHPVDSNRNSVKQKRKMKFKVVRVEMVDGLGQPLGHERNEYYISRQSDRVSSSVRVVKRGTKKECEQYVSTMYGERTPLHVTDLTAAMS